MDAKELQLIKELMEQLQGEMKLGKDDLGRRLGREEKPEGIEIMKIEKSSMEDSPELASAEEELGRDLDNDMEMGEDPEHVSSVMDEESPDENLKKRLMKIRGE